METNVLYSKIEEENISYINSKLKNTRGAIVHYKDITAIIIDDNQIDTQIAENTVWIVNTFLYNFYKDTFLYSIGVK